MLKEVKLFQLHCDGCGDQIEDGDVSAWYSKDGAEEVGNMQDWVRDKEKHYCPNCYEYNEYGDLIVPKLSD